MTDLANPTQLESLIADQQQRIGELEAQVHNLQTALETRSIIGAAVGIAMAAYKVPYEAGFALLAIASQRTNRKLRDVAEDVVLTGQAPPHHPADS